jgi:predicted DNA-binding transcriptional regulator YafY
MRRTDRLFELIQILRDGRLHRATELAERLEVSVRTVWRDMATLMASGMPVEGERGVGYILRSPITLPPMILTPDEMEALRLGVRLVAEGADPSLARGARGLAAKITAVMPAPVTGDPAMDELFVFSPGESQRAAPHLPLLRRAIRVKERLSIRYLDMEGRETHRDVRPLQLEFWGKVWTLAAFCEARGDFRAFRVDRILTLVETGETFPDEPGRGLKEYLARVSSDAPHP